MTVAANPPVPAPQQRPAFAQATQLSPYVPHEVWTEKTLLDYHAKVHEEGMEDKRLLENQRGREFNLALIVLLGFAAILAVGFTFAYMKIDLGRDIVISAVSAGLGYAAGYGTGLTKQKQ
jgi:hypothetical protein